jgi:FkbM family methyltransferase
LLRRARVLGEGYFDQARLVAASFWLQIHRRGAVSPLCLNLKLGPKRIPYWVCDLGHLYNLDEVWVAQEYEPIGQGDFDLILDLGANVGAASIWLHERHPHAQILAVEPDPFTAPLLRRNTRQFERITVVQAAVGAAEGRAQLRSYELSWGSTIAWADAPESAGDGTAVRTSTVTVTTIPALLREVGLQPNAKVLAKVDIEGSEWPLLQTPDALSQLSEIYGEMHTVGAPPDPERFFAAARLAAGFEEVSAPPSFFHWRRPSD